MATALKDIYTSGLEPFDQLMVPEGYSPTETEEFMLLFEVCDLGLIHRSHSFHRCGLTVEE